MPIARGQVSAVGTTSLGTTVAVTWTTNPQPGSTILVLIIPGNVGSVSSVVDNGTVVSTFIADKTTTAAEGAFIFRANAISPPASGSYTVTATCSSNTLMGFGIEYTGVKPGAPQATNIGGATGTAVSTGAASNIPGSLYFGGFSDASGLNPETITFTGGGSGFTERARATNGASFWAMAVADGIVAAGGSLAMTWTLGDSVAWGASIATYAPAQVPVLIRQQAIQRAAVW